jgi:hypothetical protein
VKQRTIRLDSATKKRIAELVAVSGFLLQHRNSRLDRVATIFFGLSIGAGYVLLMGIIKAGWFESAPALLIAVAGSLAIALRISITEKRKPLKIRIQS